MTNASLNDACICYMYLMAAALMAEEFKGRDQGRTDEAMLCAERMRRHLCRQFGKPADSVWSAILTDAGLNPELRPISKKERESMAFRESVEQKLDPAGELLMQEMQMHKDGLVAYACSALT